MFNDILTPRRPFLTASLSPGLLDSRQFTGLQTGQKPPAEDCAAENPVRGGFSMNLAFWLPAMFLLGLAAMTLVYLFLIACEKI
jgi:hypothetical protein